MPSGLNATALPDGLAARWSDHRRKIVRPVECGDSSASIPDFQLPAEHELVDQLVDDGRVLQGCQVRDAVEDDERRAGMASAIALVSGIGNVASSTPATTSTGVDTRPSSAR